jgi:hypothetical protein
MPRRRVLQDPTTVKVDARVKRELDRIRLRGETYSEVIDRLVRFYRVRTELSGY